MIRWTSGPESSRAAAAAGYAVVVRLPDGETIRIRAIRPDDQPRLADLFRRLSAESVYLRFFEYKHGLSATELRRLTELDFDRDVALVAVRAVDGHEQLIGVGRYAVFDEGPPRRAEVAFAVADRDQHRGIGTLLLRHLLVLARRGGVATFEADVLASNGPMLHVFTHSGQPVDQKLETGVVHVTLATTNGPGRGSPRRRAGAPRSMSRRPTPSAVPGARSPHTPSG